MKNLILVLALAFNYMSCRQIKSESQSQVDDVIFVTPIEPTPKWIDGSNEELLKLMTKKLTYPKEECIQGTVVLRFQVDTFGNVENARVRRSVSKNIDSQLLNEIVKHKFIPGKIGSRKVVSALNFPFKIKLE